METFDLDAPLTPELHRAFVRLLTTRYASGPPTHAPEDDAIWQREVAAPWFKAMNALARWCDLKIQTRIGYDTMVTRYGGPCAEISERIPRATRDAALERFTARYGAASPEGLDR